MKQNDISMSMRLAPAALAAVLLMATLGFLTLRVNAQEGGDDTTVARTQPGENGAERRALLEEQKTERQEVAEGGFAGEEMQQLREEQREEMGDLRGEQNEERDAMRTEQQEAMGSAFEGRATALREQVRLHKEERQQKRQEYKAKLNLQTQARLGQYSGRITVRMNTAIERLNQIANRALARIEMIEEKGVDLTDARNELDQAYEALEAAETFVALFTEVSTEAFTSENPSAQVQGVREAAKLTKDSLKAVHTALSETVRLIKVGVVTVEEESEPEETEAEVETEESETEETTE